ncbi:MAG: ATP synthase subunit I [Candidatus Hydrogenedentes bacterium]|nr:ATP synthase subunit I [Candidatus Hydrogenedentota bacterium]
MVVTLLATLAAWQWDESAARGVAVGGGAGALGFWMIVRSARTLTSIPKEEIPFRVYRWTFARMIVYAFGLFSAYLAAPNGQNALLGAAAGLFIARAVMLVTGLAMWRRREQSGAETNS